MTSQPDDPDDLYLDILQDIIDTFTRFSGKKAALRWARRAPVHIDKDGAVTAYYGPGEQTVSMLAEQYENFMGKRAADRRIRHALTGISNPDLLPARLQPQDAEHTGLWERVVHHLKQHLP